MTLLALDAPVLRQALVTGRFTDSVTGAGIEPFDARLDYAPPGEGAPFIPLPARLRRSRGGYFSFHLDPAREMPALSGLSQITLRVRFSAPGRAEVEQSEVIDVSDLRLVAQQLLIGGHSAQVMGIAGAPFDFTAAVAPAPVALAGHVLRDHDPETPAAGARIRIISPASPGVFVADSAGRFRIDALPVAAEITLRVADGLNRVRATIRPDFSIPVNETVLSVSTA